MIDFIVVGVILLALIGIFAHTIKAKKEGKSSSCGCSGCSSSCAGCHSNNGEITH